MADTGKHKGKGKGKHSDSGTESDHAKSDEEKRVRVGARLHDRHRAQVRLSASASDKVQKEDTPFPYDKDQKKKKAEKQIKKLQIELVKMQNWVKETNQRVVVFFEGRDGAGKGGMIKTLTEHLNPRGARIVALAKPSDAEKGQWYFQRYLSQMPTYGEICFFDRSWYNRAGVEPVFGFCNQDQYTQFNQQAVELERALQASGIRFFKIWLSVGRAEQARRLDDRKNDPLKGWKLSPIDEVARHKYEAYTVARDAMFWFTHTPETPWVVVRDDDKMRGRTNFLRYFLGQLPYDHKKTEVVDTPDSEIVFHPARIESDAWHQLFVKGAIKDDDLEAQPADVTAQVEEFMKERIAEREAEKAAAHHA